MTVLVGYKTTAQGRTALEAGAAEAQLRAVALHVATVLAHEPGDSPTRARQDMQRSEQLEAHLDAVRAQLAGAGLDVTTSVLHDSSGRAGQQLLDEARRIDAELIVIGVRRRSPVGKLVLGSVAQDVLLGAVCPVLAVKAET